MIHPVILCGGSGTRLWPVSRRSMPKQFVDLGDSSSLFQQTVARVNNSHFAPPLIITNDEYRFIAAQQTSNISVRPQAIMLEPAPKNTAPAVLAAAHYLAAQDSDAVLLVMASDHHIPDHTAFADMVEHGFAYANAGNIVTFGVVPDRPETGYGYIEAGADNAVRAFHEKPDRDKAEKMLASGRFLWNAGIFLARADVFVRAGEAHAPAMTKAVKSSVAQAVSDLDFLRLDADSWQDVPAQSVDYALMEKADNLSVVPFSGVWSDLGDWSAVKQSRAGDSMGADGTLAVGRVVHKNTTNSLLWSAEGGPVLAAAGLDNIMAVAMADAVLIARVDDAQAVRELVAGLQDRGYDEAWQHRRDYRPWGWFESLVIAKGYQVKRLHVYAGERLSLQRHKFRSEHWIVTDGLATVQIDESCTELAANQSVYINAGQKHRLSNLNDQPLTIIEVQTGSYLGEDDIERFEDVYSRG